MPKSIMDTPAKQFCKLGDKLIAIILLHAIPLILGICYFFFSFFLVV